MSSLGAVILNELSKIGGGFSVPMNGTLAINSEENTIEIDGAVYFKTGYTSSDPADLAAYPDAEVTSGSIGVTTSMLETVNGNQSGLPLYTRVK